MTKLYTDLREKAAKTAPDVELKRENGRKKKCVFFGEQQPMYSRKRLRFSNAILNGCSLKRLLTNSNTVQIYLLQHLY